MSHAAKAIAIHCMDFRFIHELVHYFKAQRLDRQYDDVSAAGGAKNLADAYDPSDTEFVLRQIALAKKLHGVTSVYLINHLDCGAYGKIFANPAEEMERHTRDLTKAKQLVERRFEDLTVKTVIAGIKPEGQVYFEEIETPSGRV